MLTVGNKSYGLGALLVVIALILTIVFFAIGQFPQGWPVSWC